MNSDRKVILSSIGAALTCLLAAALAGCGSSDNAGYDPKGEVLLHEVWGMYKSHLDARKRPPARLTDLDPYEPTAIHGYAALRDGDLVMYWGGASPSAGAETRVLAYEKQVPEQGGPVLLQDGTVKQMTAAEFNAAPKIR